MRNFSRIRQIVLETDANLNPQTKTTSSLFLQNRREENCTAILEDSSEHGDEASDSIEGGRILDQISNY
jgi:hypothetical protein